jgi:hypothetical protein
MSPFYAFFAQIIATVNTYLIILVQFSVNETKDSHSLACLYSQFNVSRSANISLD